MIIHDVKYSMLPKGHNLSDSNAESCINGVRMNYNMIERQTRSSSFTQGFSQSSGKYVRHANANNGSTICKMFNSKKGCNYKVCRFRHLCNFHSEKGIECEKPAYECRQD